MRVLEIFGTGRVRLHESSGQVAPYLCLSHCWGKNEFIKTTTLSIDRYRSEIPWSELPQTFKDALTFVSALGYKYLWIDSLCIVQDDREDWQREGSKMSEIFSNAHLTIAAASSSHASSGCFRTSFEHQVIRYIYPDANGIESEIYVRNKIDHARWADGYLPLHGRGEFSPFIASSHVIPLLCLYHLRCVSVTVALLGVDGAVLLCMGNSIADATTCVRAFQERLLSQRVVHFAEHELIWECKTSVDCECAMVDSDVRLLSSIDLRKFLLDSRDLSKCHMAGHRDHDPWYDLVEQYTRQSLSIQSDIFPALQGISKRFQRHRNSIFLAGLWESSIINDLLWRSNCVDEQKKTRPEQWRAPSWSWASVLGPVEWLTRGHVFTKLATYVKGTTTRASAEILGEITSGMITLKGRCMLAELSESCFRLSHSAPPGQSIDFITYGDRYWTASYSVQQFAPDYNLLNPQLLRPHSTPLVIGTRVKILLMAESRPTRPRGIRTHFLVLRTVHEEERLYERIGHIVLRETERFTIDSLPLDVDAEILHLI
ncbi:hypothetical protein J1614_009528 [Plenodomus biglobosus]|nr:hypothetical protein J1614_009528 [Plenodomus biglobosus]